MTRYTMPARSQGNSFLQRTMACLERDDVRNLTPEVECAVRTRSLRRLNVFHCELQSMYAPQVRSTSLAGTHIVLNNTPPLPSMAQGDEAVGVDARDAVKAPMKATGLNPHLSVCGRPFRLDDLDGAHTGGGAA